MYITYAIYGSKPNMSRLRWKSEHRRVANEFFNWGILRLDLWFYGPNDLCIVSDFCWFNYDCFRTESLVSNPASWVGRIFSMRWIPRLLFTPLHICPVFIGLWYQSFNWSVRLISIWARCSRYLPLRLLTSYYFISCCLYRKHLAYLPAQAD